MNESARRNFIKKSAARLTGLMMAPLDGKTVAKESSLNGIQDKKLNIICFGAHPGDPEFGCGGTMAKYSDAGHNVIFLYLTRGEASDPSKSHSEMATLRSKEADNSCKVLNVKPRFVGQIDGDTVLNKRSNDEVEKLLIAEKPDLLFTQWPLDTHADHQVTGLLALTAWAQTGRRFDLYFYEVNTGSETMAFTPTDYVDISSVRERKKEAMFAHKTQDPERTYLTYFKPLEEFRGLESGVTAAEAFIHFKAEVRRAALMGL